jgi:hypothetical protein
MSAGNQEFERIRGIARNGGLAPACRAPQEPDEKQVRNRLDDGASLAVPRNGRASRGMFCRGAPAVQQLLIGTGGKQMRITRMAAVALATAAVFGMAQAAEIAEGAKELTLSASFTDVDDLGQTLDLDASIGWFLTSTHEIGAVVSYFDFSDDTGLGADTDFGSFGAFYRYNFSTSSENMVPFVGAQVGFPFGDTGDFIDYTAGVEAGTRIMFGPSGALNFAAFYDKAFAADDFEDSDGFGLRAGISIFLGNK